MAQGDVLITFRGPDETEANTFRTPLNAQGYFVLRVTSEVAKKLKAKRVSAHYPGRPGYAPCDAPTELAI